MFIIDLISMAKRSLANRKSKQTVLNKLAKPFSYRAFPASWLKLCNGKIHARELFICNEISSIKFHAVRKIQTKNLC